MRLRGGHWSSSRRTQHLADAPAQSQLCRHSESDDSFAGQWPPVSHDAWQPQKRCVSMRRHAAELADEPRPLGTGAVRSVGSSLRKPRSLRKRCPRKCPLSRTRDLEVSSPEEVWALVRAAAAEQDSAMFLTAAFTGASRGAAGPAVARRRLHRRHDPGTGEALSGRRTLPLQGREDHQAQLVGEVVVAWDTREVPGARLRDPGVRHRRDRGRGLN